MARHKTNIEKIVAFMEQSPVCQALVMVAMDKFTELVVENKDELLATMDNPFIHPQQWINCARDWRKRENLETVEHDT